METYQTIKSLVASSLNEFYSLGRQSGLGLGLALGLIGCGTPGRQPIREPEPGNNAVADMLIAAGYDLNSPGSMEELEKAIKGQCDVVTSGPFYNTVREKKELILACDIERGNGRTENRWTLNIDSVCNLLYRDQAIGGVLDIDWLRQDELYIVTREGNAFSIYLDEKPARELAEIIQTFMQGNLSRRNLSACVDVAQYQMANYSRKRPLKGLQRKEAQKRFAAWFKNNKNGEKVKIAAVVGNVGNTP